MAARPLGTSEMRVASSELIKDFEKFADQAEKEPVHISHVPGDLVMLSAEEFDRLMRRWRKVVSTGEFTDDEIELIKKSEVPAEYAYLDEELKDWNPEAK